MSVRVDVLPAATWGGPGRSRPTRVVRISASSRRAAVERYGAHPPPSGGITIGLARLVYIGRRLDPARRLVERLGAERIAHARAGD